MGRTRKALSGVQERGVPCLESALRFDAGPQELFPSLASFGIGRGEHHLGLLVQGLQCSFQRVLRLPGGGAGVRVLEGVRQSEEWSDSLLPAGDSVIPTLIDRRSRNCGNHGGRPIRAHRHRGRHPQAHPRRCCDGFHRRDPGHTHDRDERYGLQAAVGVSSRVRQDHCLRHRGNRLLRGPADLISEAPGPQSRRGRPTGSPATASERQVRHPGCRERCPGRTGGIRHRSPQERQRCCRDDSTAESRPRYRGQGQDRGDGHVQSHARPRLRRPAP